MKHFKLKILATIMLVFGFGLVFGGSAEAKEISFQWADEVPHGGTQTITGKITADKAYVYKGCDASSQSAYILTDKKMHKFTVYSNCQNFEKAAKDALAEANIKARKAGLEKTYDFNGTSVTIRALGDAAKVFYGGSNSLYFYVSRGDKITLDGAEYYDGGYDMVLQMPCQGTGSYSRCDASSVAGYEQAFVEAGFTIPEYFWLLDFKPPANAEDTKVFLWGGKDYSCSETSSGSTTHALMKVGDKTYGLVSTPNVCKDLLGKMSTNANKDPWGKTPATPDDPSDPEPSDDGGGDDSGEKPGVPMTYGDVSQEASILKKCSHAECELDANGNCKKDKNGNDVKDESKAGEGIKCIIELVIDILTVGVGVLSVVGISIVGIQYLTSGGNEEKAKKAKRRLLEVVIGVVLYVFAYAILKWLLPSIK